MSDPEEPAVAVEPFEFVGGPWNGELCDFPSVTVVRFTVEDAPMIWAATYRRSYQRGRDNRLRYLHVSTEPLLVFHDD